MPRACLAIMRSIPNRFDGELKCEYCDEVITDDNEASCDGSLYNGIKLCIDCLDVWQYDEDCNCETCYESKVSNDIDCKIDDYRLSDDEYDAVYGE